MNGASQEQEMVGLFAGLVERQEVSALVLGIEKAISESFAQEAERGESLGHMTRDEVKRRFNICCEIFKSLRGECHWSIERIVHALPKYLRCELDGESWEPEKRAIWMPEGTAV